MIEIKAGSPCWGLNLSQINRSVKSAFTKTERGALTTFTALAMLLSAGYAFAGGGAGPTPSGEEAEFFVALTSRAENAK